MNILNRILTIILVVSIIFVAFASTVNKAGDVIQAKYENVPIDTVILANPDSLLSQLSVGDSAVQGKIKTAATTVTSLKTKVAVLENKVVKLTQENATLKKIVDATGIDVGNGFKLLPISSEDRK